MQHFGKGLYWTLLVGAFGLAQLWVNLAYLAYTEPEVVSFHRLTGDGLLLFFALAITMSVTMDYWFEGHHSRHWHLWKATAFVFYPIGITGVVIGAYLMIAIQPMPGREALIDGLNLSVVCLTLLYAIVGKTYLFWQVPPRPHNHWRMR